MTIILIVVLVIAAVGGVGYIQAQETVEQDTERQMKATMNLQSDSIGQWVEDKKQRTRMISQSEAVSSGSADDVQQYIDIHGGAFNVRGVHFVNTEEGVVEASSYGAARGAELESIDEPWTEADYSDLDDNDVRVGDSAYRSPLLEDDVITFVSPAYGWSNRVIVVVAGIESQVNTLYQPLDGQQTTVVDRNGDEVLTGIDDGGASASRLDRLQFDNPDNTTFAEDDSGEYAYAYTTIDGTDDEWIAVTSVPTSSAYAVSSTVQQIVGAIIGVSLISLLGAAVILGRHTVTPLTRLRSKVKEMEEGELGVDLRIARTDEIGELYSGFDTMRDSLREKIVEVQDAREEAEQARDEAERMNDHLEAKADEYNEVIDDWAEGDLTRRLDPESESEAMAEIAHDLNEMVADLEMALDRVKQFANETAVASEQVAASTQQVRSASQQVTESIQEISAGAERQNDSLLSAAEEMNNLSATTEEIASLSSQVADLAERTAGTSKGGHESAREALEAMEQIETRSEQAVEEMRQLREEEVDQIDELIEYITEIAKETNMLALNANIEASRSSAGDDGDGFGVVAEQVKELSQDAKEAADEIERRLESIREQTERSANEVEQTSELIDDAGDRVQEAVDGLEEIAEYAQETNTGVQEISSVTEEQASTTEEVVTKVEEVTTISEETTAESETVASAAEEQNAALIETSKSVEDLSKQAVRLSDALNRFDTEIDEELEGGDQLGLEAPDDSGSDGAEFDEPEPDEPDPV